MRNSDWAYFAGLFDGEGSVTVAQVTRKTATQSCRAGITVTNMSLRIANNNPVPLIELEEKFGGRVRLHSSSRPDSFVWIISGHRSVEFAEGILPYTRIKSGQLEIYLAFSKLKRDPSASGQKGMPLSRKEILQRERLIVKLRNVRVAEGGKD